ncbi:MAG: hypothetical protein PVI71_06505 [Desulfobacterales bacterium]|jgi:hypothetical protein
MINTSFNLDIYRQVWVSANLFSEIPDTLCLKIAFADRPEKRRVDL